MKIKIIREYPIEHCDEEVGFTLLFKYGQGATPSFHVNNRKELKALRDLCSSMLDGSFSHKVHEAEQDVETGAVTTADDQAGDHE